MGRPRKDIDPKVVAGMASVGANNREIAAFVGCDEGTIRERFSEVLTKARATVKTKLRRKQLAVALQGNVTMLIWLGKQMLNQSDRPQLLISAHDMEQLTSEELHEIGEGRVPLRLRLRDVDETAP